MEVINLKNISILSVIWILLVLAYYYRDRIGKKKNPENTLLPNVTDYKLPEINTETKKELNSFIDITNVKWEGKSSPPNYRKPPNMDEYINVLNLKPNNYENENS